ncbi:MAG: amidohydrolase family protein [Pirellulaceae bacterium]|nr:amidohydrolase family protein [Pirellulaceae bacterium]
MIERIVDVNVHLARWPTRRLPLDETAALVRRLRAGQVQQAWAGSFDGLLHRDIGQVNRRLADECQRLGDGLLLPFGTLHPALAGWEADLVECHERLGMRGIRLYPSYHGYGLDDSRLDELLREAERRQLIVCLAVRLEDERTQHPLWRVPSLDTGPLDGLVERQPGLRLVLCNALRDVRPDQLGRLAAAGQVYVELSNLEGVGGVARLLEAVPLERVLFGSHAPFFYFQAAVLKLRESELPRFQVQAITHGNAQRLLENRGRG